MWLLAVKELEPPVPPVPAGLLPAVAVAVAVAVVVVVWDELLQATAAVATIVSTAAEIIA
jgi:hypothetical protein